MDNGGCGGSKRIKNIVESNYSGIVIGKIPVRMQCPEIS